MPKKKTETVANLTPADYNPRKITAKQLEALGKSMQEFGDLSGIIRNIRTGLLIGGHQRIKHFDPKWPITKRNHFDEIGTSAIGEITTPFGLWAYREVDWPEEKEKAANIAANKHGGYFDMIPLQQILRDLNLDGAHMELTGFDTGELEKLLLGEEEWAEAGKTAEEAITALSTKIKKIAKENPGQMNRALAVIVNNGRGNPVLFLTDPNTADIVKELKRYADSGEDSPLECLVRALIQKGDI